MRKEGEAFGHTMRIYLCGEALKTHMEKVTYGRVALEDGERVGISVQLIGFKWTSLLAIALSGDILASVHTVDFSEWNSDDSNSSENSSGQLFVGLVWKILEFSFDH